MHLSSKFQLPCGATLNNRIAKSAMSENLSDRGHGPSEALIQLYDTWGKGGAGLSLTGNVMIDRNALGEPKNVVVEDKKDFAALQKWAKTGSDTGTHLWPQLNHPGRQAMGVINKKVVAPSAVRVKVKGSALLFKTPSPLTEEEIWEIIERFGNTAAIMQEAGFSGVQIHGAHGYLVSQFLSPLTNLRTDKWGGSLENRARFVIEVYRKIRSKVGAEYPVGIKINSADFQRGGFTAEESMEVVKLLSQEGIDLIEISGGTYERASMMGVSQKKSTREREAYFLDYIEEARKLTTKPLMLTGGFRTLSVMENVLEAGKVDIIGIARPFTLFPHLPNELLSGARTDIHVTSPKTGIKALDKMGFLDLYWYEKQLKRLGHGLPPKPSMGALPALFHMLGMTFSKVLGR